MTGYRGQKFDFTGIDDKWYALFSSPPSIHVNMRGKPQPPGLDTQQSMPSVSLSIYGCNIRHLIKSVVDERAILCVPLSVRRKRCVFRLESIPPNAPPPDICM